jgi:phage anti-repressor protein
VASFYCYLNHQDDFVIDLDDIWKWLDFQSKFNSKRLLEKNFTIDKDYKRLIIPNAKQTTQTRGGHNKEIFMLKINTFKRFCLKAGTKKADEIHEYFIKLDLLGYYFITSIK